MKYIFITDAGTIEKSYQDYLADEELASAVRDKHRAFLNLGIRIVSYDRKWLSEHPRVKRDFELLQQEQMRNPLRFYLPCCARSGFDSDGHRFINDQRNTITGIHAGNRYGKTTALWIKQLTTRGLVKCDPKWEIFTDHGIRFREFDGPKTIGIGTYEWDNHVTTIWPQVIQAWTPADCLGDYGPNGTRWPNFKATPRCEFSDGSIVYMKAYSQNQSAYESQAMDGYAWDEQPEEAKFDGANMRVATRRWWFHHSGEELLGAGWHDFGLTPHKVDGRADTGAGTFIHAIADHSNTKGMTAQFYKGDMISDTPDWIYAERVKEAMLHEWIEMPAKTGDQKKLREGRSRLYGDWHASSGLVYDDWQHAIHVVETFTPPDEWTRFRAFDHGTRNPFAYLAAAVSPEGDCFIYDEYISVGPTYSEHVAAIVKRAGNDLRGMGDEQTGGIRSPIMREVMCGTRFFATVMDGRSFKYPDLHTNQTLGDAYRRAGLTTLRGASGLPDDRAIPIVAEWLRIDYDRHHAITKEFGAPRLYVMGCCKQLIQHIERYVWKTTGRGGEPLERPQRTGFDHDLDALKYLIQIPPRYVEGFSSKKEMMSVEEKGVRDEARLCGRVRDKYTAY